jgi:ribosomal protein L7Ae-like RNA K-turn-binding protein
VAEYIDRNRKAGGLYISLNVEEAARELEGLCDKSITVEYVQEERSLGSTKNIE